MSGLLMPLLLFGGFAVFVGFVYLRRQHAKGGWSTFADLHDVRFSPPGLFGDFLMRGDYRGESIRVETVKRGHGRSKKTYTQYTVELPSSVPMGLLLYDEGLFSKLGKMFGGQDIQVGRPDLDSAFIIRGGHEQEVREFLDRDTVADAFLEVHRFCSDFQLEHGTLQIERRGLVRDADDIEDNLEPLIRCAKVLKNAGEANAIGTMDTYESESADEDAREPEPVTEW
jgi:hypothetical protein